MTVSLRKFPFPYRAGLALSSDVDNTPDVETYFTMMDYLNGNSPTRLGDGLGLEIGNSFWFFNGTGEPQLSYYDTEGNETDFAEPCRQLWASGHIDTLHTYGDFDNGGFSRQQAEVALTELARCDARLSVWVNHGNSNNSQNVGPHGPFEGGQPNQAAYHADLTAAAGVRYYWVGRLTHILGQDARNRFSVRIKIWLQELMRWIKYRNLDRAFYDSKNRLLIPTTLQDGSKVWDFQRWVNAWGGLSTLDANDLALQLKSANIARLIENEGFLVLYTHMTESLDLDIGLPTGLADRFLNLQSARDRGELMIATTARLLRYHEVSTYLKWSIETIDGRETIKIESTLSTPIGDAPLTLDDLQGLTFYCDQIDDVVVVIDRVGLEVTTNDHDHTGRPSVSIPWKKLVYPRA